MTQTAVLLLGILRAVIEVALLALLGQGLLFVLAGSRRDANPIYVLFRTITTPAIRVVRRLTPRQIIDRHVPVVSVFLLFWLWIFLAWTRRFVAG